MVMVGMVCGEGTRSDSCGSAKGGDMDGGGDSEKGMVLGW